MNKVARSTRAILCSIRGAADMYGRANSHLSTGSIVAMTEYLIAARAAMIIWVTLAVMPAELVFDAIEAELERRGVEP
jgi:hypothetical protein